MSYRFPKKEWFPKQSGFRRIYFREDVGRLRLASPFSSKDSRAYRRREQGVRTGPESALRILIMRAKLWASSRRWNICVFAGRGLWLNYHSLFPLRAVDLRRPLPAPPQSFSRSLEISTTPHLSFPSPFFFDNFHFPMISFESMKKGSLVCVIFARREKILSTLQHSWPVDFSNYHVFESDYHLPRNPISNRRLFIQVAPFYGIHKNNTISILLNESEWFNE